ncbi:enoyl-CoA hydratase-related protein [Actinoplanes subtropicus]|uniref:enoyl-CoA hydratase-related protein n=1 Tax=Actinoplanes subtropicus TaxID=543632 RepID=UPI0006907558|nr:enoyl-CoA hydratase-related protein [Actinoplanes subtropicus]
MTAVVEYELADGIATITLNRPDDLNAVDLAVCDAMAETLSAFENDPRARVAVLTGRGRVFCAGADLKAFAAGDGPKIAGHRAGFGGFVRFPRTKPIIAAVNGHALAEPDLVYETARTLAEQIRAPAPLAVAATLRVARAAAEGVGEETAWRLNDELLADLFDTADAGEGQRAFVEKRRPAWTGR